jgi:hypothetical protein
MPNVIGTTTENLGVLNQILADVKHQSAIGCLVQTVLGVTVGNRKIAKAGTPINVDLKNEMKSAVLATATVAMTGVLLHDVDVTDGVNNGTVLLFGFVNLNRIDTDVQTKVTTALTNTSASKLVTFMKV